MKKRHSVLFLLLAGITFSLVGTPSVLAQKTTLLDQSRVSPTMIKHGDSVILVWTGRDGRINSLISRDGVDWSGPKTTLSDKSDKSLALASLGGYVYLAWKGTNYSGSLNIMRSRDGIDWSNKVTLDEESDLGPSLAAMGDRLFISWRGSGNKRLNVMQSSDGMTWRTKVVLDDEARARPALASTNGRLYLSWTDMPYVPPKDTSLAVQPPVPPGVVRVRRSRDGIDWGSAITTDAKSNYAPALTAVGQWMIMAWTSTDRGRILLARSEDGIDWSSKIRLSEESEYGPAVAPIDRGVAFTWIGLGNQKLNIDIRRNSDFGINSP